MSLKAPEQRTRGTPIYNIGATSRLTGMPIWTLRWVERHGLVSPSRTGGRQRLFSDEEIELLNAIRQLMEEHVNLAGIRIILRLRVRLGSKAVDAEQQQSSGPRGLIKRKSSVRGGSRT